MSKSTESDDDDQKQLEVLQGNLQVAHEDSDAVAASGGSVAAEINTSKGSTTEENNGGSGDIESRQQHQYVKKTATTRTKNVITNNDIENENKAPTTSMKGVGRTVSLGDFNPSTPREEEEEDTDLVNPVAHHQHQAGAIGIAGYDDENVESPAVLRSGEGDIRSSSNHSISSSRSGRRTNHTTSSSQRPGAFRHFPGDGSMHLLSSAVLPSSHPPENPEQYTTAIGGGGGEGGGDGGGETLAHARPVDEEEERMTRQEATPVDHTTNSNDNNNNSRSSSSYTRKNPKQEESGRCTRYFWLISLCGILLVALVIAVPIIALSSSNVKNHDDGETAPSTTTTTTTNNNNKTQDPTAIPPNNDDPSSWVVIDEDSSLLSNTTWLAIKTPLSPQNKAYEWLAGHPNIHNMTSQRKVQLLALATFFYCFHGESWIDVIRDDFLVYDKSECDWYSAIYARLLFNMMEGKHFLSGRSDGNNETTCNQTTGDFIKLNLVIQQSEHQQQPHSMPPEIGLLTSLEEIKLDLLRINGPLTFAIIPEMKELSNLRSLRFGGANLTGTIPPAILSNLLPAPTMEEFEISGGLTGTIPTEFQTLTNLRTLRLQGKLDGTIPKQLGRLRRLEYLEVSPDLPQGELSLTGSLPEELYGLSHLSTLDFSRTALTGSLAPQLGRWTQMEELKISANLSGTIPSTISDLLWLETVDLRNNRLSGSLPILTNSDNLRRLELSNNYLTGSMPANMFANQEWRESLNLLRLDNNYLTGTLPDDFWKLTSLRIVYLGNNVDLSGSLPASKLGSFPFLAYFNLSHGSFYGSVPFAAFSNSSGGMLNSLVLNGNQFSGSISSEVGLLTRLSQLNLADNGMLNGSIPEELGNCTWMKSLELQGNAFSGSIPTLLGKLRFMNIFNLSNNTEIGGQIPSELGLLTRLQSLVLDGTSLSGSVPEEVCSLQNDTIGSLIELRVNCSSVSCGCNCTCVG